MTGRARGPGVRKGGDPEQPAPPQEQALPQDASPQEPQPQEAQQAQGPQSAQPRLGAPARPPPRRSPTGQGPPGPSEFGQDPLGLRPGSHLAAGHHGPGQPADGYRDAGYPAEDSRAGYLGPGQPADGYRDAGYPADDSRAGYLGPGQPADGYRDAGYPAEDSRAGYLGPGQPADGYRDAGYPAEEQQAGSARAGQLPGLPPNGSSGRAGQADGFWQPGQRPPDGARQAGRRPPAEPLAAGPLILELRAATRSFSAWAAATPAIRLARARLNRRRSIALIGVVVVLGIGLLLGWASPKPEAEATVQQFLLAWQSGQYRTAAAMTDGGTSAVATQLQAAYRQLGAADLALSMGHISQHGRTAQASFGASFDLGRGGPPWTYQGHFTLHRAGSAWKVNWSPSVIAPALRPGDRLAVVTTVPPRAQLLDQAGRPLARRSPVYLLGVRPADLKHPEMTALALARTVGSPALAEQMAEQIQTAPGSEFLELVTLQPATYHRLSRALGRIPGLSVRPARARLFDSIAPAVAGSVGTEIAPILQANGVPYRPGTTIGLSGLQQAYQRTLAGTPTTQVVLENAAGRQVAVLQRWNGSNGSPVRTTISAVAQRAADGVVGSLPQSAAIVAVRPSTGQILAVAQHQGSGMPAVSPLDGHYQPGQAFTIVSTAALLADTVVNPDTPTLCRRSNVIGSQRFVNQPAEPDLGQPRFSQAFAHACATAFTALALNLKAADLASTASKFGIGPHWQLPGELPVFAGAPPAGNGAAQLAANSIGVGSVRVSPLGMALAAGVVQAGSWHQPTLITRPAPPVQESAAFHSDVVSQLRALMRAAVRDGAARAADVRGSAVYGQVGSAPLGQHGLWTNWFVGFNGNVAFAVLSFGKSPANSAAALAGRFVRALHERA